MKTEGELNEKELEKAIGGLGITNPASGLTEEEAKKIAEALGDGTNQGSWTTMSGEQFMEWWQRSHEEVVGNTDYYGGICG